jgi:hypothetical protein
LVLVLVFNRGDVLVQGMYGCCFEEVVGGMCCHTLNVVAMDGARVFGGFEFVDVLVGYC